MNPNEDLEVVLYDNCIFRTFRSHKPYGRYNEEKKLDVDIKFKECFIKHWKKEENDTYVKIMTGISEEV